MLFFVVDDKKLSSHMPQISEHINSSNKKTHSYDQMRKMVVNLGSNKVRNNDSYSPHITCLHNFLPMIIVDTPENDLSSVDHKSDIRKIPTSLVKSS